MKFTNLRLVGFKSFVDTTDFDIRDGLTGIVGPNGCGKSNLLEALRWVMGATSAKALRGGGMSDVIFAGTSMRPARNWAEVILTLDNADRTAPAEYNEEETLEVSRRIIKNEDGAQSIYRINNKEVRAKDVQLLFADAATGANSPALVRQGQISELINAKPQNRRRLLEEAAGVTGLHSRRHEAELRLRAAEQNLERLTDVTGELETQKTTLARQARQATRYRNLSGDIRRTEATAAYLRWQDANNAQTTAQEALQEIAGDIEETARAAALAATAQTDAHEKLDPLRQSEAEAAARLQRLTVARENIQEEAARAEAELQRLTEEAARLEGDLAREKELAADALEASEAILREEEGLKSRETAEATRIEAAQSRLDETTRSLTALEETFEEKNREHADIEARRRAAANAVQTLEQRLARITTQIDNLTTEREKLAPTPEQAQILDEANQAFTMAQSAAETAETVQKRNDETVSALEAKERDLRAVRDNAVRTETELKAECDAIQKVLGAEIDGDWMTLIEAVRVSPGYETALAAALGDDLSAALDDTAPTHWALPYQGAVISGDDQVVPESPLPLGAQPLSDVVDAPEEARRRLAMIGVVSAEDGRRLAAGLSPGQRLVSKDGDLWRWDGFVKRAEAKTAAAIRLEQRNRLTALQEDLNGAIKKAEEGRSAHTAVNEELNAARTQDRQARTQLSDARRLVDSARQKLASIERDHQRASARLQSIAEAIDHAQTDQSDAQRQLTDQQEEVAALPQGDALAAQLAQTRENVGEARRLATEARAAHNDLAREAAMRQQRLEELAREKGVWATRGETARGRLTNLETRLQETQGAREAAADAPQAIEQKAIALGEQIADAETSRQEAADTLASAVNEAQNCDRHARAADSAAAEARELRARVETQLEAALARVEEATALAQETCNAAPDALLEIAEIKDDANLPAREDIDRKLERYKRERENLGGVNLRADEELQEINERLDEIAVEQEDCEAAIRKLRASIGSLNREARERLRTAFETVNTNFSSLFTRLFNGGQAELRMIDSEDVLEAGLEIFASPPGKKLASMSLMSGGEQALTATALIFAVFMSNPAPVCVLDEVDAPLDDANTERFCHLLNEMTKETGTRFIIITHHALTMSRMDRLFGVTMIERGVSQLVSVDLNHAEQLVAAE